MYMLMFSTFPILCTIVIYDLLYFVFFYRNIDCSEKIVQ